ncbi:DUF3696 domain-containing protein [Chitinophaga eiseniae]|uniref:DUF3696 domain-containing protein n=1 Tax=Chitinophaga eiseniae TaxID=634771 RepID=A0A847S8W4_9BACT|nr:DUF3696 domain-containing protein [Chitinophaga eiseniae]NLR79670.1 DUF3696 domain-containing protein [Chitinophaga eiseniae]
MIEKLRIKNFKSHKDTSIALGHLTVLCGQNGVGKSSLIQALLLLRQTNLKNKLNEILDLNSPLCFIGKTKDALYLYVDKVRGDEISIILGDNDQEYSWAFDTSKDSSFLTRLNDINDSDGYNTLSLFTNDFQYISAARSADYENDDYEVQIQRQLSIKKGKGELTAQYLYTFGKVTKVNDNLLHPSEPDTYLLSQTTAWEREISKGVNIKPKDVGGGYEIKYSFINSNFGETEEFSSENVGFGLSYSLPIIVAILSATPGSLLLIENPEAHLHPYGQSKLAELMCLAGQAGVQIIVETHSDHIINGILVQCKKYEKSQFGIDKKNLKIYSFDRDETEHATVSTEVIVDAGGKLQNRPSSFFDQIGKDIRALI